MTIVFDRRDSIPAYEKDEKDLELEKLRSENASLKNQVAHLKFLKGVEAAYDSIPVTRGFIRETI